MLRRLEDKVIVVAGAGGIGNELARRYAAEGASVVLGDMDAAMAEEVAREISESGGTAIGIALDGADNASIKAGVDLAVSRFGGLDGFHANYASFADGESGEDAVGLPLEIYDEVMHVNARGFLLCTRHAIPAMLARGGGSMVYTTSGAAFMGEPLRVAYAMSKVAVHPARGLFAQSRLVRFLAGWTSRPGPGKGGTIPPLGGTEGAARQAATLI